MQLAYDFINFFYFKHAWKVQFVKFYHLKKLDMIMGCQRVIASFFYAEA